MLKMSKLKGGLGCKELLSFNLSLLSKMSARIIDEPNSLWVRRFREIYFSSGDFFGAAKVARTSWIWSFLIDGPKIVMREGLYIIGDRQSTRIYTDHTSGIKISQHLHATP